MGPVPAARMEAQAGGRLPLARVIATGEDAPGPALQHPVPIARSALETAALREPTPLARPEPWGFPRLP